MPSIADLLARNEATAKSHTPLPYISELPTSGLPPITTIVVTCCDPRCIPETFLDINPGEVVVHRNAGGNIRDAARDISILDALFKIKELAIIHHTDCGTLHFTDDGVKEGMKARVDKAHWAEIDAMELGANKDMVQSVKSDLEWVRANPFIREELKQGTQGFMFDIKTGKVEKVAMA